ncbi:MAG TPA: signal peptidase I [Lachnospiraceae bacterium]|nr:signal peptidase I [Lachnospiraceae bacterium]
MLKEIMTDVNLRREIWEYARIVLVVTAVMLVVNNFLLINAYIPSESMVNTVQKGDRIFGNRLAYRKEKPKRFDVIIFRFPDDEKQLFIKRVIGLPGETVNIVDGKVYIDGSSVPLDDSFIPEVMRGSFGPYTVPEGSYFVLGDNRNYSEDSRFWKNTFVAEDKILGKAVLRYFPFTKIGWIR